MPVKDRPAYMSEPWFEGLQREIKASTQRAVAERMGVSRPTLSVLVNGLGEYGAGKAKTDRIETRYRQAFEQISCPHTGETVGAQHCREKALRQAPTHNPLQLNHWKACQDCRYKPAAIAPKLTKAALANLPQAALDTKTLPLPEVGAPQIQLTNEETT
ncbi:MarR family transcriptional regulator [Cupriavidus basilensis]|uniref:MarR family transcriptional regulator n=1 Tax=Cupriavidus basilensis TaxID=68895 RepID=UPI0039F7201E